MLRSGKGMTGSDGSNCGEYTCGIIHFLLQNFKNENNFTREKGYE